MEHESLSSIPRGEDRSTQQFNLQTGGDWIPRLTGGRSMPFISTSMEHGKATLSLHQDGRSGRRNIVAEQAERTVLSGVLNTELPLRQVLCNTHSPAFISYQNILPYVLPAYITSRVDPEHKRSLRTTRDEALTTLSPTVLNGKTPSGK